MSGVLHMNFSK